MRSVLVTGAGRGLGAMIARHLAADGYAVVLADVDPGPVERLARELGPPAVRCALDVRSPAAWDRARPALLSAGEPWALINCAARTVVRDLLEIEPDEWDDVLAVNLRGPFLGIRAVGPLLAERRGGRIVNVGSDSAYRGKGVTGAHYASSKAGLLTLTRRAAATFAASGVTVNALAPGTIDGDSVRELSDPAAEAAALPTGRLVDPGGIASLVAWLLSDAAADVTGSVLRIDGGASL